MKKISLLILCLVLPMVMMSGQDKKFTFERFGFKSEYIPVPTVFNETVTVMGNPGKGSYYFYIPSDNFQIDVEVTFLENGDANAPFAYYYIGSGMVGNKQYNKVILSTNAKLSDIAKGCGNSIDTPFDEKYHVNVVLAQINGLQVNDMLTCDLYFIENPSEQEKQVKLEQEQAKMAKEKADSIAAIECIQEYTQRVDKSNIQSLVEDFEIEYYKKHTDMLRRDLYNGNNTGSGLFAYNLEKEYEVYLYVDAQSLKAIKINRDVLDRNIWYSNEVSVNPKKYEIDGVTYIVYGNGFVYKTEVKTNLYAGYSNGGGFVVQKKKDKITYKEIIGSSSMGYILGKEINSNDIPSIVSLKLDEILSENGKYEVEYIFADNTLLFLLVTTKQRTTVVYRLLYNDLGEIEISGLLADTK